MALLIILMRYVSLLVHPFFFICIPNITTVTIQLTPHTLENTINKAWLFGELFKLARREMTYIAFANPEISDAQFK